LSREFLFLYNSHNTTIMRGEKKTRLNSFLLVLLLVYTVQFKKIDLLNVFSNNNNVE